MFEDGDVSVGKLRIRIVISNTYESLIDCNVYSKYSHS